MIRPGQKKDKPRQARDLREEKEEGADGKRQRSELQETEKAAGVGKSRGGVI